MWLFQLSRIVYRYLHDHQYVGLLRFLQRRLLHHHHQRLHNLIYHFYLLYFLDQLFHLSKQYLVHPMIHHHLILQPYLDYKEQENLVLPLALSNFAHLASQILEPADHAGKIELRGAAPGITRLRSGVSRGSLEGSMTTMDVVRVQHGDCRRR